MICLSTQPARAGAFLAGVATCLALLAASSIGSAPAEAAFSGLNGRIACSGVLNLSVPLPAPPGQSRLEIFDIDPDGSGERRVTNNEQSDATPKYSPDGQRIAFQRTDNQIWTMDADGGNEVQLTTTGTNSPGSWSPDGGQIVFQSNRDGNNEIYKMNANGAQQTRLTNVPQPDQFPAWSPDGTKILFRSNRDGNPNLYTMDPTGANQRRLTDHPEEESGPAWSPDGSQIAFHTDRDEIPPRPGLNRNLEIYRMDADGSNLTRLTFNDFQGGGGTAIGGTPGADLTGYDLFPAWSPEGDEIVFHSGRAQEFRDTGQAGIVAQWDVYVIDAEVGEGIGGYLRRLTNRAGNDERCDWQPIPFPSTARPTPVPTYPQPQVAAPLADCPQATANVSRRDAASNSFVGKTRAVLV